MKGMALTPGGLDLLLPPVSGDRAGEESTLPPYSSDLCIRSLGPLVLPKLALPSSALVDKNWFKKRRSSPGPGRASYVPR